MDSFQVKQVVVGHINTNAEIEAGVSPIYDLEISELNKICVLGIANCNRNHVVKSNLKKITINGPLS